MEVIVMSSQKRLTIAACALFIMLGFLSGGISKLWESKKENSDAPTENVDAFSPAEDEKLLENEKYTVKIQDGILVVFNEADDTRPIIVTDIYAGTLRHFDREQLAEGIVVNGELELQSLLEDFSS